MSLTHRSVKLLFALSFGLTGCGIVQVHTRGGTTPAGQTEASSPSNGRTSTTGAASTATEFVTVVGRFNDIADADAMDLAKVKSVLSRATPDMLYAVAPCAPTAPINFVYRPVGMSNAESAGDIDGNYDASAGTPDHPFSTVWTQQAELRLAARQPAELAPGTPVVVWSMPTTGSQEAIVVTLDGGRYRLATSAFVGFKCKPQGGGKTIKALQPLGAVASFPPPVQHQFLGGKQILAFETSGQLPAGTSKALEDARAAGGACSSKLYNAQFAAKAHANEIADILPTTRQNRAAEIVGAWQDLVVTRCAPQKKAFDAAFNAAIQARTQARLALYSDAAPKVKQLVGK